MANISIVRLMELERAEKHLAELEMNKHIRWVGESFGMALATIYATTPWDQWPIERRQLLRQVCGSATMARQLYIDSLPKE